MYVCMYTFMSICMYVCTYVCIYVCMNVFYRDICAYIPTKFHCMHVSI